jgi:hypothetical protein
MPDERPVERIEPFGVQPGFIESDIIRRVGDAAFRILYYDDGPPRFEHRCESKQYGTRVIAPALAAHTITHNDVTAHEWRQGQPTVTPSINCPDCDLHGFVVDGWWRDA